MTRPPTAILWVLCCCAEAWAQPGSNAEPIAEDRLLAYATGPFDSMLFHERPFVLGTLGGVEVVVSSSCSDLCPAYTTRIIHFDVPEGRSCTDIGGVERAQQLGGWGGELTRCFPRIIAEHWENYVNPGRSRWVSPGSVKRMRLQGACEGREGQVIERREGPARCPENLPTYVSFIDLTIRPTALHEEFVSVVGFVGSLGRQTALFMTEGREEENSLPLRNPETLTLAPPCRNQAVRIMGTFHAAPIPEIVVAEMLIDETRASVYGCE